MKTRRLFFIDWTTPHGGWSVGLGEPSVDVDWSASAATWSWDWHAFRCRDALLAAEGSGSKQLARVSGSITANNWVLGEVQPAAEKWYKRQYPGVTSSPAAMKFSYEDVLSRRHYLAQRMLRPSREVLQVHYDAAMLVQYAFTSRIGAVLRCWERIHTRC